ncbi:hypothetical protein PHLGIDRAFT_99802 [Phlebiopsis gigantea 11061_1 CR5-6]|uniref:PXA domain-containing protein n=1 Tax=Phlebiopsis gigantea (strain 11061_1 CR5-6) TaxID=745531 RepID=A0A0C3S5W4_PHLG1|nr:hypothetical protein PHLGIDRAFT_99802 [Phlebiopsis gigantea 11061_1 CR5-6]
MATPRPVRRQPARSIQSLASSDRQPSQQTPAKPASLARRLLFPHLLPDAELPPLLVSSSASPELDDELYNFVAIALRAYVHPWWTKITRYDKELLPGITRVLTHVIQDLEARLVQTDLAPLVLRDLPILLTNHYTDYHNVQAKLHTSYASGASATLPQLFHQLQPHLAVAADGTVDEAYIRQALDDVLRTCLPSADYEPETERYIVREIMVKVVLEGVLPKVSQPWFIHQSILTLLGPAEGTLGPQRPPLRRTSSQAFSFQSLIIWLLSTVRFVSGACLALMHAYRHARNAIKIVNQTGAGATEIEPEKPKNTIPGGITPLSPAPPSASVGHASVPPSPPPSPSPTLMSRIGSTASSIPSVSTISAPVPPPPPPQLNYVEPILRLFSTLLTPSPNIPPRTIPLALTHVLTLLLTLFTSLISRLLPHLLYTHAFSPDSLLTLIQASRHALFPGGWPAVSPPDPSPEEQAELRQELTRRLLALVPGPTLDPLSSQECNAHLLVFVLDLVLLTLFPEMGIAPPSVVPEASEDVCTPRGSLDSTPGYLTPPRPDSRPP